MNLILLMLRERNALLFWFGLLCLVCGVISFVLVLTTRQRVMGINRFVKPTKFFISIWLFCWTMGWFTGLLVQQSQVGVYSWVVVITMIIELVIITGQAALGNLSHFNISSPLNKGLFMLMGISITVMTLWTGYIGYLFWAPQSTVLASSYLWGIRLGIIVFVVSAFEGGLMAARLSHTVGGPDGGPGLRGLNWSTQYGDLRVAHFVGMHALQILPLLGYYVVHRPGLLMGLAVGYFVVVLLLVWQALHERPLLVI